MDGVQCPSTAVNVGLSYFNKMQKSDGRHVILHGDLYFTGSCSLVKNRLKKGIFDEARRNMSLWGGWFVFFTSSFLSSFPCLISLFLFLSLCLCLSVCLSLQLTRGWKLAWIFHGLQVSATRCPAALITLFGASLLKFLTSSWRGTRKTSAALKLIPFHLLKFL